MLCCLWWVTIYLFALSLVTSANAVNGTFHSLAAIFVLVTYSHNFVLSLSFPTGFTRGTSVCSAAQFEGSCHLISRPTSLLLGDQVVKLLIQFCLVFGLHHCTLICSSCHLISRLGPLSLGINFFLHTLVLILDFPTGFTLWTLVCSSVVTWSHAPHPPSSLEINIKACLLKGAPRTEPPAF